MKHIKLYEEFVNEKNEYLNERTKFDVQKLLSKADDELYNIIKWKDDASCYVSAPADAKDIIDAVKSKYPKSSWDPKTNLLVFESEEFLNEGKSFEFSFNYNTDEDDVEYVQNILHDAGVDATAEPGIDSEEMMVKAKNAVELRKAKKAIQADGFEVNESLNEEITLNSPSFKNLVKKVQEISDKSGNDWDTLKAYLKGRYAFFDTHTMGTNPAAYVVNFFAITKGKDEHVKKKPSDYVQIGDWYIRPW